MSIKVLHLLSNLGATALGQMAKGVMPFFSANSHFWINLDSEKSNSLSSLPDSQLARQNIETITYRSNIDVNAFLKIRQKVKEIRPKIIHAWGPTALRLTPLLPTGKAVASHCDLITDTYSAWSLKKADVVLSQSFSQTNRLQKLGIETGRIQNIPIAVKQPNPKKNIRQELNLPENARLIIASGGFDVVARLKYAIWAFDVVRQVHPDIYLLLLGDGPLRKDVEKFASTVAKEEDNRIRFLGHQEKADEYISAAQVVWLTHSEGGLMVAYQALAAGVCCVGMQTPDLKEFDEIIKVKQDDPVALATKTNQILTVKMEKTTKIFSGFGELSERLLNVYRTL